MPKRSHLDLEEDEREERAKSLAPHLTAFLQDPTNHEQATTWLGELGKACPMWTLKKAAFSSYAYPEKHRLIPNLAWYAMEEPTAQRWVSQLRNQLGPVFVGNRWQVPKTELEPEYLRSYLWQAYRHTLLDNAIPFTPDSWKPFTLKPLSELSIPNSELDSDWEQLQDDRVDPDVPIIDQLRYLIADRAMAEPDDRATIQTMIDALLLVIGAQRGRKEGFPNRGACFEELGREARLWIETWQNAYNDHPKVVSGAQSRLARWGCHDRAEFWTYRLAFPFLTYREIKVAASKERERDLVEESIYLVHARFPGYKITSVASNVATTSIAQQFKDRKNPYLRS